MSSVKAIASKFTNIPCDVTFCLNRTAWDIKREDVNTFDTFHMCDKCMKELILNLPEELFAVVKEKLHLDLKELQAEQTETLTEIEAIRMNELAKETDLPSPELKEQLDSKDENVYKVQRTYSEMGYRQLLAEAKERGLTGYSKKDKKELAEMLVQDDVEKSE